jgi:hypothetical protein
VLLYAVVALIVIAGMSAALLSMNLGVERQRVQTHDDQLAFYAAEAGLSDAFMQFDEELLEVPEGGAVAIGSEEAPLPLGAAAYWAEVRQVDTRSYSIVATGRYGRDAQRLELVLSKEASGFFQYAAFGANGVVLDSNAFVDSYDSALGTYESQVQGGNEFALEHGNVGSNSDIVLQANTEIHGDAIPGPAHYVDDTAPNVYVSGSTESAEEDFELPPIEIPPVPTSGSISGTEDVDLGPGDVHYDSILMNGGATLTVRGPARLVVDDFEMKANTSLVFDATDGPIEVYSTNDFVLQSNSTVQTISDTALDVTLLLAGNNMTANPPARVEIAANSEFVGAIYAPDAQFRLASNFDIFGSIICGYLDLSSFGEIHYDEALLYDGWGSRDEYVRALWRRLPRP